ncbi:MAG: flippase-like domain-containing protein [Acidimicrobiaceae bacterium]|nr:flippase-like domain-containing protein [Acidimicrobiaceae bacterium]
MTGEARPDTVAGGALVEDLPPGPVLTDPLLDEPAPIVDGALEAPRRRRRWLPRPVLHIGRLLLIALVVEYLLVPNIAGTRKALHLMGSVSPLYLLLGVVLEVAAIVAYAALTRTVLGPDRSPGMGTMLRIQLTTLSVSHVVPGGSAAGSSLGYRLLRQAGVKRTDVGFALATQGLGSAVILNVLFWLALVVSIPVWGFSPLYVTAALAGVALFVFFTALVLLLTRGDQWLGGLIERVASRLSFVQADVVRDLFDQVAARVHELGTQRHMVLRAAAWALANWLLDAASLFVFVGAFGHWVNPDGLLVAYGLANVLAAIPLVPGGLGVVEATLTSALVGFGTTRAVALLGVLAYRFVNFWLPIPVGGLSYLSLQVDPGHTDPSVRLAHLRNVRSWVTGPVEAWRRRPRRDELL